MSDHEVDLEFVADGQEHALDPNWVTATRLQGAIVTAIPAIVSLIGLIAAVVASSWRGTSVYLAFGGWLLLWTTIGVWSLVSPALRYKRRSYRLDEVGLRIRQGLVFRSEVVIPRSRVQHTDVSRGPIERSFDLATLVINTAGTVNASTPLDGLPVARAYRIRDLLLEEPDGSGDAV